jgi:hypothetical protein
MARGHPAQEAKLVTITPKIAEQLLERNGSNRPLSPKKVGDYAADMKLDRWKANGETMKIDWNGDIQDGQHRLWAVLESGVTIKTWIIYNCDPADFTTIDRGKTRNLRDAVAVHEGRKDPTLSAALRWVWRMDVHQMAQGFEPTHDDILGFLADNPEIRDSCAVADGYTKMFLSRGQMAALHFVFARVGGRDVADTFIERFALGASLMPGDAVLQLRDRFLADLARARHSLPVEKMAIVVKTWNIDRGKSRPLRNLGWRKDEAWPIVL